MQDSRWKIKEKFVGKCFPIFSRAAVPRLQPDASEGAKNRLTVFTFASDPRFQESTKIARERRPRRDERRSLTIVRGLASFKFDRLFRKSSNLDLFVESETGMFSLYGIQLIQAIRYLRTKNSFDQVRSELLEIDISKILLIFFFG